MKTILILEDEPPIQAFLTDFCEHLGHKVIGAGTNEEGLTKYHEYKEEIRGLVIDWRLPDGTSNKFFEPIREDVKSRGIGVLVISGSPRSELGYYENLGIKILSKPFRAADLELNLPTIQNHLPASR